MFVQQRFTMVFHFLSLSRFVARFVAWCCLMCCMLHTYVKTCNRKAKIFHKIVPVYVYTKHGQQFHDAFLFAEAAHNNNCLMEGLMLTCNINPRSFMYNYVLFFDQRKFSVAEKFPIYELSWNFLACATHGVLCLNRRILPYSDQALLAIASSRNACIPFAGL